MNKSSFFMIVAAVYGLTAVALSAMGQHVFGLVPGSQEYGVFQLAYIYQILHALLLIWIASSLEQGFWLKSAAYSISLGILFFCGGLYGLILFKVTAFKWVTPVGGSLIILGWLNLVIHGFKKLKQ